MVGGAGGRPGRHFRAPRRETQIPLDTPSGIGVPVRHGSRAARAGTPRPGLCRGGRTNAPAQVVDRLDQRLQRRELSQRPLVQRARRAAPDFVTVRHDADCRFAPDAQERVGDAAQVGAGAQQLHHGCDRRRFDQDARRRAAVVAQRRNELLRDVPVVLVERPRIGREVRGLDVAAREQRVAVARDDAHVEIEERADLDPGRQHLRVGQRAHDDIEIAGEQPRMGDGVDPHLEVHSQPRKSLLQIRDGDRQQRRAPEEPRPDTDPTALSVRKRLHFRVGEPALRIDQLRVAEQRLAERCQRHAAGAPLEQRDAVVLLEAADALRQRRLRHRQLACRGAQAAGARHRQEIAQQRRIAQECHSCWLSLVDD